MQNLHKTLAQETSQVHGEQWLLNFERIIVAGMEVPNGTQDVNRALSLLSTNSSWCPYETKSLSLEHSTRTTHSITQHRLPLPSSEYWHTDQQNSSMCISFSDCDSSNRFQDFQLLSSPYESGFPCNQLD